MFEEALQRARFLDAYLKKNRTIIGPLHGVPMSVKDQFNVEGFDSTIGYVGRCDEPASQDATMVSILTSLGAVIITKTTVPQSIMVS
jgi:amidase